MSRIRATAIPVLVRRGGRRFSARFQGAIINGLLVTWRCGHSHETKLDAQQCAEHEAWYQGLPVPSILEGAHEGPLVSD